MLGQHFIGSGAPSPLLRGGQTLPIRPALEAPPATTLLRPAAGSTWPSPLQQLQLFQQSHASGGTGLPSPMPQLVQGALQLLASGGVPFLGAVATLQRSVGDGANVSSPAQPSSPRVQPLPGGTGLGGSPRMELALRALLAPGYVGNIGPSPPSSPGLAMQLQALLRQRPQSASGNSSALALASPSRAVRPIGQSAARSPAARSVMPAFQRNTHASGRAPTLSDFARHLSREAGMASQPWDQTAAGPSSAAGPTSAAGPQASSDGWQEVILGHDQSSNCTCWQAR